MNASLLNLDQLKDQYLLVSNKTKALHTSCEQLLQQQVCNQLKLIWILTDLHWCVRLWPKHGLIVAIETIGQKLTYFNELEPISKVININSYPKLIRVLCPTETLVADNACPQRVIDADDVPFGRMHRIFRVQTPLQRIWVLFEAIQTLAIPSVVHDSQSRDQNSSADGTTSNAWIQRRDDSERQCLHSFLRQIPNQRTQNKDFDGSDWRSKPIITTVTCDTQSSVNLLIHSIGYSTGIRAIWTSVTSATSTSGSRWSVRSFPWLSKKWLALTNAIIARWFEAQPTWLFTFVKTNINSSSSSSPNTAFPWSKSLVNNLGSLFLSI